MDAPIAGRELELAVLARLARRSASCSRTWPSSPTRPTRGRRDVARAELARGSTHGAPERIDVTQVIEHGLRYLSWLSRDDAVIRDLLPSAWTSLLAGDTPEPFRALGGAFVAPA